MNPSRSLILSSLATLAATAPALAQSRLIALTRGVGPSVVQYERSQCRLVDRCAPLGLPAPTTREAGGTAYDPRTGGVWISDGTVLAKVDPDTCRYQCPPIQAPVTAGSVVTGLAMQESHNRLFIVDSAGVMTTAFVRDCVTVLSRCRISVSLPQDHWFSGLAVDEARGLVLYSASNFAGTSVSQAIYVARADDPCNPVCATRMAPCPNSTVALGAITGLAFDPCTSTLIATDGAQFVAADFSFGPSGCIANNYRCCGAPVGTIAGNIGLCLRPGGITQHGRACTNGACGLCPGMTQRVVGDPSIGNAEWRFVLENAPPHARAFWALNRGSCQFPGLGVPGFCGPIHVPLAPLPPIVVGPFPTGGGLAPCDGSATVSVPVPLDTSLCGDDFASQFLLLCFSPTGAGTGLSTCAEFVVGGT